MTERRQIFDGAATTLTGGVTLVEASAGTGKTFAISMLVLRAVVELGIELSRILVVTYTVAATEELRGRIRSRLVQARNLLRSEGGEADRVLSQWLGHIEDRQQARKRLELALLDIDAIGIHTIHGFCQRILAEQILESNHFFDTELISDVTLLRRELLHDFWREHLYNLEKRYASLITAAFADPNQLHLSIRGCENPLARLFPESLAFAGSCDEFDGARERLQNWWGRCADDLRQNLREAARNGYLKPSVAGSFEDWFEAITASFAAGSSPDAQIITALLAENLVASIDGRRIRDQSKRTELVAGWILPGEAAEDYLHRAERLLLSFRLELARFLRSELGRRLRSRGLLSFDELISELARALDSAAGDELARQVGSRYEMALIDEFQDTDSAQYKIFSSFFGQGDHYLYLIGDPKQAIYRFRGADIHSYLEARKRVDQHLTLDCNFRSNPGLVKAVNGLLRQSEIGGTIYQPVRSPAEIAPERLLESGIELPGLIYCQLDRNPEKTGGWPVGEAEDEVLSWVVNEVLDLIRPGSTLGVEKTEDGTISRYPVRPGDIGILVRTNRQAERFFDEFSRRGVPVVLSSRKPVFQTRECEDLLLLLQGVATPSDDALLRTVLGRDWFGLDGKRFWQICADENLFNHYRQRFHSYHSCWHESGLLAMMSKVLEDEQVFLNLSRRPQAERRITNIQHLLELIQKQQSERRLTISQTLIWLQEKLVEPASVEEAELRLESDADAVNVLTMHSAKGLEYQIVFCPFLYRSSVTSQRPAAVGCYNPELGRICDLGSERIDYHDMLSRQEETDEDMRLAYVAITRARLRSYLVWVEIKQSFRATSSFASPLGKLLFAGVDCSFEQQRERLQRLGTEDHCQYLLISPGLQPARHEQSKTGATELKARDYPGHRLQSNRIRTSFSGLTALSRQHRDDILRAGDETGFANLSQDDRLPGGVRFGNMIHEALERFNFGDLAAGTISLDEIGMLIRRYRFAIDPQPLADLLSCAVSSPLAADAAGDSFSLATIAPEMMVKEMEFTLHLDPISTADVNRILKAEETLGTLAYRDIEGYLSGFVDLIFKQGSRFYVADYKTNNLGEQWAYGREGLRAAMRDHNYGLQYWLYTLVVHRYLQTWLPGYRYDDHFGGVLYLFVRGMHPDNPGSGVFFERPAEKTLKALDRCFGSGGHG